jgi:hypothetical protein
VKPHLRDIFPSVDFILKIRGSLFQDHGDKIKKTCPLLTLHKAPTKPGLNTKIITK